MRIARVAGLTCVPVRCASAAGAATRASASARITLTRAKLDSRLRRLGYGLVAIDRPPLRGPRARDRGVSRRYRQGPGALRLRPVVELARARSGSRSAWGLARRHPTPPALAHPS